MPRVKLDKTGLWIAKPGYDVNTAAQQNLLFSPNSKMFSLSEHGLVNADLGSSSIGGKRITISFTGSYSKPPLVFLNGVIDGNNADVPLHTYEIQGSLSSHRPKATALITTTQAEFYVRDTDGAISTLARRAAVWHYFVLRNTLE